MKINIFENKEKEIDLERLIDTRALICANSGGGKSYAARRIMEETAGKAMSIIFDIDGEFKTLREKYDFLLIGDPEEGADVQVNMNAASLLPRKIMELEVSTIIDISEFSWKDRINYVKKFLRALLELPRDLWKGCLVFLDESHKFCGQQEKQDSTFEVIDLMSLGRKRGYCGILMSQRISKLHKDAAAEANNVFIGRTTLDIDQKRAGEIIGFSNKNDIRALRNMKDGEFWVFGSAIDKLVEKVQVSKAKTTHPKRGTKITQLSKPTDKIKNILSKISYLPEQAKKELKDKKDYQNKIAELTKELAKRPTEIKEVFKIDPNAIEKAKEEGYNLCKKEMTAENNYLRKENDGFITLMQKIGNLLNFDPVPRKEFKYEKKEFPTEKYETKIVHAKSVVKIESENDEDIKLGLAEKEIYTLLYKYPNKEMSLKQIGVFTGRSWKGGGFRNAIGHLNTLGLIERLNNAAKIKEMRSDLTGEFDYSLENISKKLGKCEKEIFDVLKQNPYEEMTLKDVADQTPSNYIWTGGGFRNAVGRLNTLGIIERGAGTIKLNPELLEI